MTLGRSEQNKTDAKSDTGSHGSMARDLELVSKALDVYAGFKDMRAGGPGDVACGEWLEEVLAGQGFSVTRQVFDTPYFEAQTSELRCGETVRHVSPQGLITQTGSQGVKGAVKTWHPSAGAIDPKGAIVLMDLPKARYSQLAQPGLKKAIDTLSEQGAAGIVLITNGPSGERIDLNADPFGAPWPQPVVAIAPGDAEPFFAAARDNKTAELTVQGDGGMREAFNLIGKIERGPRHIVISTPRSGWGPCMGERGPGIGVLYALAHELPRSLPEYSLTFLINSAHEYDNLGSHHCLSGYAPATDETDLWFHLGAGFAARDWHEMGGMLMPLLSADPQRFLLASQDFLPVLREVFAGLPGLEQPYPLREGAAGEVGEIIAAGYPRVVGMLGAHRYHHAPNDTADKTAPEFIAPVLQAVRETIRRLTS